MTAEGWDGKSIRKHLEHAEAEAGRAIEIAEEVEDRLGERFRELRVEVRSLREAIAELRQRDAELLPPDPNGSAK